ncbi:YbjQ family protein [Vibrio fluvialis]|nr:YbjQ family protein [Vibrio fluvialis]MBY7979264.1 YbjQ family protein [Vibrio fluvialis]
MGILVSIDLLVPAIGVDYRMKNFIIFGKDDLVIPVDLGSDSVVEELDAMAAQGFRVLSDSCTANNSEEAISSWEDQISLRENYAHILTSTTHVISDGYSIEKNAGVVTSTIVIGANILRDAIAEVSNIVGGQSMTYMSKIESSKEQALLNVRKAASDRGCNAVIGLSIDVNQVSGGGKSMFMITASGTAVVARAIE